MTRTGYKIAVDLDGEIVVCTDGLISGGRPEQRKLIRRAANSGQMVQVVVPFGQYVQASNQENDPVGNFAAIVAASGRWKILVAPVEVLAFLDAQMELGEGEPDAGTLHV